jgi:acyl carrier protein
VTEHWDSAFETAIRSHLKLLPEGAPLHPDGNLQELGLDSMPMVELVVDLEEMYQVTFPGEYLTYEVFGTPRRAWQVLVRLRAGDGPR